MSVLRASSLAAVTIFVWSTRLNFSSCVSRRTVPRASTMSCSERTGTTSERVTGIGSFGVAAAQELHAALDVERGPDAGERQPELDQRDRDRRLHPDDHGARVE